MTTNTQATKQVYRVYIKATPEAIWDAITKPEWTDRYGYGGRVEVDLRPGEPPAPPHGCPTRLTSCRRTRRPFGVPTRGVRSGIH